MHEFPFHKGARTSLTVAGVLLVLLCLTTPVGFYFIWRVRRGGVSFTDTGLKVDGLTNDSFEFADVERLGALKIPLAARGIGGALANARLGGLGYGINLVVKLRSGKTRKFLLNQFEKHEALLERIKQRTPVPCEEIPMGLFGWKWPERAS